jgi:hypothetical protein
VSNDNTPPDRPSRPLSRAQSVRGHRHGAERHPTPFISAAFDADAPDALIAFLERDPTVQIEWHAGEVVVRERNVQAATPGP